MVLAVALVGMLAAALPARASCDDAIVLCDVEHDETTLETVALKQIATIVPLRGDNQGLSLELYDQLIPEPYEPAALPAVAVTFSRMDVPREQTAALASTLTRYEGTIALRITDGDQEGWFPISRLTSTADAMGKARAAGFPAYLGAASLTPDGTAYNGEAKVGGLSAMSVRWVPSSTAPVTPAVVDLTYQRSPYHGLVPAPLQGTQRTRVRHTHKPALPVFDAIGGSPNGAVGVEGQTAHGFVRRGQVTLRLDPDLNRLDDDSPSQLPDLPFGEGRSLADLIRVEQTLPGLFWGTDTLVVTQFDNLDDGKDGPLPAPVPAPPAAAAAVVAPPNAGTTGFANPYVVISRGSTVDLTNLDSSNTHDIISERLNPDTNRPLFQADYANFGETKRVQGVEKLAKGRYEFLCSLHTGMRGQLLVL
jgi:plastocyanin